LFTARYANGSKYSGDADQWSLVAGDGLDTMRLGWILPHLTQNKDSFMMNLSASTSRKGESNE